MSMPEDRATPEPACGGGGGSGMTLWFVILGAITVLAVWLSRGQDSFIDRLQAEGRTVTGRVTDVTSQVTNLRYRTGRSYFVHYDYVVDGRRLSSVDNATEARALRTRKGDAIAVTFLPADPKRTTTSIAEARHRATGFGTQGKLVLGIGWVVSICRFAWLRISGA